MTETSSLNESNVSSAGELSEGSGLEGNDKHNSPIVSAVQDDDDSKSRDGPILHTQILAQNAPPLNQEPHDQSKTLEVPKSSSLANVVQSSGCTTSGQSAITPQVNTEQLLQKAKRDLESMVLKYAKSERENLQNQIKVEDLEKKLKRAVKDNDQLANRIKLLTNDKNQLTDTLNAKVAQLTVLEQKNNYLNNAQGTKLKESEEKIQKLEASNEELLKQIETYKSKEGELLDFSERLSMKHMMLQSELNDALNNVPSCREQFDATIQERDLLIKQNEELSKEVELLRINLKCERENLNSLKNEKDGIETKYRNSVDELQNEIKVMRRKHQIATKELVKGIKQLQAQLEKVELDSNAKSILKA